MTEITYSDNVLTIGSEQIELRTQIHQVLEVDDVVLVVLEPHDNAHEFDPQNVLAFDQAGNKLWEVEPPDDRAESHEFVGLARNGDDVVGTSRHSHRYRIDLETGAVEDLGYFR